MAMARSDDPGADLRREQVDLPLSWALGLVLALAAVLPCAQMIRSAWWGSHDNFHYPLRTIEFQRMIEQGFWYPRWAADFYQGWGAPFFNYYPPGVYAVSAGLSALFDIPASDALKLYVLLMSVAGVLGMMALVRAETRRLDAAVFAALLFAFMPYRYTDLYTRGDIAEYAAIALLPYPLWLYRTLLRGGPALRVSIAAAASITHALVIFTHTIIGQWGTEWLALLMLPPLVACWRRGERRAVYAFAAAFAGALGLSAIYTVPALLERNLVHIEWMTEGHPTVINNLLELVTLHTPGFYHIGEAIEWGLAATLVALMIPRTREAIRPTLLWWIPLLFCVFLMSTGARDVWPLIPLGRFVQFPWRMLAFVVVFGAVALGGVWAALIPPHGRWRWVTMAILCGWCGLLLPSRNFLVFDFYTPDRVTDLHMEKTATTINHEYLPIAVEHPPMEPPRVSVLPVDDGVTVVATQHHGIGLRLQVTATGPSAVDVQRHWFPGWTVRPATSGPKATAACSPAGLIRLELPAAGDYDLVVELGQTTIARVAAIISGMTALLLLLAMVLLSGRRSRSSAFADR
jgi:hypothetical protein